MPQITLVVDDRDDADRPGIAILDHILLALSRDYCVALRMYDCESGTFGPPSAPPLLLRVEESAGNGDEMRRLLDAAERRIGDLENAAYEAIHQLETEGRVFVEGGSLSNLNRVLG